MPPASPTNQERKEEDEGTEEAEEAEEEDEEEEEEEGMEEEEESKELLLPKAPVAAASHVPSSSHARSTIELAAQQRSHTSHAHSLHPCMYLRSSTRPATRGEAVQYTHTPG